MTVVKRDGRKVEFDKQKIRLAVLQAFNEVDKEETSYAKEKSRDIANYIEEYAKKVYVNSHRLREKLIRDGIKKPQCELCLLEEWQGKKIPLELHHKDGNHYNNDFENLQILCPNCHALQENNSGAALKKNYENFCVDCGAGISKTATRCKSCSNKMRHQDSSKNNLSREELKDLIRTKSFLELGKKFGVSDNAIRKWCDAMSLPRTKKEINSYSDEEWDNV